MLAIARMRHPGIVTDIFWLGANVPMKLPSVRLPRFTRKTFTGLKFVFCTMKALAAKVVKTTGNVRLLVVVAPSILKAFRVYATEAVVTGNASVKESSTETQGSACVRFKMVTPSRVRVTMAAFLTVHLKFTRGPVHRGMAVMSLESDRTRFGRAVLTTIAVGAIVVCEQWLTANV